MSKNDITPLSRVIISIEGDYITFHLDAELLDSTAPHLDFVRNHYSGLLNPMRDKSYVVQNDEIPQRIRRLAQAISEVRGVIVASHAGLGGSIVITRYSVTVCKAPAFDTKTIEAGVLACLFDAFNAPAEAVTVVHDEPQLEEETHDDSTALAVGTRALRTLGLHPDDDQQ